MLETVETQRSKPKFITRSNLKNGRHRLFPNHLQDARESTDSLVLESHSAFQFDRTKGDAAVQRRGGMKE